MGRPRVEFTSEQEREIHRLFNGGMSTKDIGKLFKCGRLPIQRLLGAYYNEDLRTVRSRKLRARDIDGGGWIYTEYPEGFEAGVRQALTWVHLHGLAAVRTYCNDTLLPWREHGRPDLNGNVVVPAFRT